MQRYNWLIVGLLSLALLMGGVGFPVSLVFKWGGVITLLSLLVVSFVQKSKVSLPKGWRLWVVFWLYSLIAIWWSHNPYAAGEWQTSWLIATICWVVGYRSLREREMVGIVVGLGVGFLVVAVMLAIFSPNHMSTMSFVEWATINHHHLGDWWSLGVVAIVGYQVKGGKGWWKWILVILGIVIVGYSQSRSAIVATVVGVGYLWWEGRTRTLRTRGFGGLVALMGAMFVGIGVRKTTLFSRIYFLEGVQGLIKQPMGVGMGSFVEISREYSRQIYYSKEVWSSYAHNLPLEVLSGLGIVGGGLFVWWLGRRIWQLREKSGGVVAAIWIATLTNMLFDYTYMIPAYLWIWFLALGVWQRKIKRDGKITQ